MGLGGGGLAARSSARQTESLRAFAVRLTGANLAVKGLSLSGASVIDTEWATSSGLTARRFVQNLTNVKLVKAEDSGHNVQSEQPSLVIEAIYERSDRARANSLSTTTVLAGSFALLANFQHFNALDRSVSPESRKLTLQFLAPHNNSGEFSLIRQNHSQGSIWHNHTYSLNADLIERESLRWPSAHQEHGGHAGAH